MTVVGLRRKQHYHDYAEMTALMKSWEKASALCSLSSIGRSQEGRELWLMTITDSQTGPAEDKPAFWCEANTHAGEITGTEAALHLIDSLLTAHEKEDGVGPFTALFKSSTVYVLPRISVDGAELFLKTPFSVRSSPIMYPGYDDLPGLKPQDLTGDGEQLVMRIADPAGGYKCAPEDPRIMVPREVDDYDDDETYYRLLPEGVFEDYDGETQDGRPNNYDLNRQFPSAFKPGGPMNFGGGDPGEGPPGAGPYPLFLPEGQYVMKAISEHNNIVAMLTYHTTGRILIQAAGGEMNSEDLAMFAELGEVGKKCTGYEPTSVSSTPGPMTVDWAYYHRGILAWLPEIWSMQAEAGLGDEFDDETRVNKSYYDLVGVMQFCDKYLPEGSYFNDWQRFEHPQLGPVEIGGFKFKKTLQNPPELMLEGEIQKLTSWAQKLAQSLPRVKVKEASATPTGGGCNLVRVRLSNEGHLPTYGTLQSMTASAVRKEALVKISLPEGMSIVGGGGATTGTVPHLMGRAVQRDHFLPFQASRYEGWVDHFSAHETTTEWIVKGTGTVEVEVNFQRGGKVNVAVAVDGDAEAKM